MAERIRKLTNSEVEVLARIIADTMTGSQMNEIFQECGVQDASNESTKWKRIYYTFLARQEQDGASNSFLNFIKKSLKPVRFISGQNGNYDEILLEINKPIIQPNIKKEQQTPKIQYFRGFLYILKIYQTPSKHTKMFR